MKKFILDILFPIHCLGCGKEGKFICSRCLEQIPPSAKPIESDKQNGLKRVIAATDYENSFVKNIIYSYKYNFVRELSKPLGILMAKALTASLPFRPGPRAEKSFQLFCLFHRDCVLIPVPLHKKRLRWRGFNQSELLCQEIAKILNIAITGDILSRAKNTPPQAKIKNFFQRKTNIQNAFALNRFRRSSLRNKTVILVDDVATTGATLQECAKAIAPLKPKLIYALVFAH